MLPRICASSIRATRAQQLRLQLAAIGGGQRRVDLVALVQPGALVQRDFPLGGNTVVAA